MDEKEFVAMFKNYNDIAWTGDNAFQGLEIIRKYIKDKDVVCGADHDIIYSVAVYELISAGITKEDAEKLRKLNWMVQNGEYMACFV